MKTKFTRATIKGSLHTVTLMKKRALARGVNGLPTARAMDRELERLMGVYYACCLKDYQDGKLSVFADWRWTS